MFSKFAVFRSRDITSLRNNSHSNQGDYCKMPIFQGQIRDVRAQRFFTSLVHPAKVETRNEGGKKRNFKVPSGARPLQMTAYSAYVEVTSINTPQFVVFPVPLSAKQNRVQMLDMSKCPTLFTDLELLFPLRSRSTLDDSQEQDPFDANKMVIRGYKMCKALYELYQFVNDDTIAALENFYRKGYAFLLIEFSTPPIDGREVVVTGGWLGPIAYVHEIIGVNGKPKIYVPTRHYLKRDDPWVDKYTYKESDLKHDNPFDAEKETLSGNDDRMMEIHQRRRAPIELMPLPKSGKTPIAAVVASRSPIAVESHWDHRIYVVNLQRVTRNALFSGLGVHVDPAKPDRMRHVRVYIDPQKMPREICHGQIVSAHKIEINSSYKYRLDLWI